MQKKASRRARIMPKNSGLILLQLSAEQVAGGPTAIFTLCR
jgi:hypothetical protein